MSVKIPFLDLQRVNNVYEAETLKAVDRVVRSGRYLHGPEVKDFEYALATACGVPAAVGVSNGLDALRLIFRAYVELGRLKKGDGVIVQANTYIASILPLTELGLRPVLIDMDSKTLNLDWHRAEAAVDKDESIKAILAVHLYGTPCWDTDVTPGLIDRGLLIVEDNAQAIGAFISEASPITGSVFTGGLGHAAAFSFYPTKNVGALGDAGSVTTIDEKLASTIRALGNYGSDRRYHNIYQGWNCRLDEVQAAALRVRLNRLSEICEQRRQKAKLYSTLITNPAVRLPYAAEGAVWHQYVVRVADRDHFRHYLEEQGVGTDIHYAIPPHQQPCYANSIFENCTDCFPQTNLFAQECVSLPIASASLQEITEVADIINSYNPQTYKI